MKPTADPADLQNGHIGASGVPIDRNMSTSALHKTPVAIYGAGGLGRSVHDILLHDRCYEPVAYLDSDRRLWNTTIDGLPVRGDLATLPRLAGEGVRGVVVAIGDNPTRVRLAERVRATGLELVSAIHPLATIAPSARLGRHLIIGPRALICVHAELADHCVVLSGAIVEHDNHLEAGVLLHPAARLAGGVHVGRLATLGIGACVIPYRTIGPQARVAPGAVVIRDVLPGDHVAGVPAQRILGQRSRFVADAARRQVVTPAAANAELKVQGAK